MVHQKKTTDSLSIRRTTNLFRRIMPRVILSSSEKTNLWTSPRKSSWITSPAIKECLKEKPWNFPRIRCPNKLTGVRKTPFPLPKIKECVDLVGLSLPLAPLRAFMLFHLEIFPIFQNRLWLIVQKTGIKAVRGDSWKMPSLGFNKMESRVKKITLMLAKTKLASLSQDLSAFQAIKRFLKMTPHK